MSASLAKVMPIKDITDSVQVEITDWDPYNGTVGDAGYHTCYANYLKVEIWVKQADLVTNAIKFYDPLDKCNPSLKPSNDPLVD